MKLVLLGDTGVGKSSILHRLKAGKFINSQRATLGYDYCSRVYSSNKHKVTIWDTAGMERYHTLTRSYLSKAHGVVLVYSVDDPTTLEHLSAWKSGAVNYLDDVFWVLVGNKSDLGSSLTPETVHDFMIVNKCDCAFTISAKSGEGLESAFETIVQRTAASKRREEGLMGWSLDEPPASVIHICDSKTKRVCCN